MPHFFWMAFVMEEYESFDPMDIRLFRADAVNSIFSREIISA